MRAFAVGPRREMAETAVVRQGVSIALACQAFGVSEKCYPYSPKLKAENEEIVDLLVGLTDAGKIWGIGLCFLHLRNVKGHPWNHKRTYSVARQVIATQSVKRGQQPHLHGTIAARRCEPRRPASCRPRPFGFWGAVWRRVADGQRLLLGQPVSPNGRSKQMGQSATPCRWTRPRVPRDEHQ